MNLDDFVSKYWTGDGDARKEGRSHYMVRCPLHGDNTPSLSLSEGDDGRILVKCFSCGAGAAEVCAHLGVPMSELMGSASHGGKPRELSDYEKSHGVFVEEYVYKDENGQTILIKERRRKQDGSKTFIQKVPSEPGEKFAFSFKVAKLLADRGQVKPLYKLPELLHSIRNGKDVYLCEGEKDVNAMRAHGFVATTTVEGAGGKWAPNYSESLQGARMVFIIPDNDKPPADKHSQGWQGQQCAVLRRDQLRHDGVECRVLELPELYLGKPVKDPYDFFAAGGSADDLQHFADQCRSSSEEWIAPWLRPGAPGLPPPEEKKRRKKKSTSERAAAKSYKDKSRPASERLQTYGEWLCYRIDECGETVAWGVNMALAAAQVCELESRECKEPDKIKLLCKVVVAWLQRDGKLYYHAQYRDFASEMYFHNEDKRLWTVDSDWFRSHVAKNTGLNREDTRFKKIMAAVQDEALQGTGAVGVMPELYWASRPGTIYISCGEGRMARIKAGTVEMVDNGTDGILFPLDKTLVAWELTRTPRDPFTECSLWRSMETTDQQRLIFKLWAMSIPFGFPAKPPLSVTGGPGSGKTAVVNGLFRLLGMDPRSVSVESGDRGETNLWVQLHAGGLILLDNIDIKIRWFANTVEAASTGGTKETKRLYTDTEIVRLFPRSFIAITSVKSLFASSAALADRMLHVELQRITGKETKESELYQEIEDIRDDGMTFIAQTIAATLADRRKVQHVNRRHPDFGRVAVKIGRALGIEEQAVAAMQAAEIDKYVSNLRADWFGQIFMQVVRQPMDFDAKHFINLLRGHPAYGEDFVVRENVNPVKVGKAIEKCSESLRFCYKMTKKNRSGVNIYHVEPTDFILSAAAQAEDADPDASPAAPTNTIGANSTSSSGYNAINEGDDDAFEFD